MSATDELRHLLDERVVEWGNVRNDGSESEYLTEWQFDDCESRAIAVEWAVGSGLSLETHRHHLTPAQAIAATLGSGKCELESVITFFKGQERTTWACKSCGARFESFMPNAQRDEYHIPRFCPNCGRRVE